MCDISDCIIFYGTEWLWWLFQLSETLQVII